MIAELTSKNMTIKKNLQYTKTFAYIDYSDHLPFDLLRYQDGCLKVEKDMRTKYHLEKIHKKSAIIKKKLKAKLKNVWFGRDNEGEYIILIELDSRIFRVEAKEDRAFLIPKDEKEFKLAKRNLIKVFGRSKITVKGDNNLIEIKL